MTKIFIYGCREKRINYAESLEGCGAEVVFSTDLTRAADCHGLLLPGGDDIDPARYGQKNTASQNIDDALDSAEWELVRLFTENSRPIFGICRGLQVLNCALGGNLIQDLPTAGCHRYLPEAGDQTHFVNTEGNSFLLPIYGNQFSVNSAHHQGAGITAPCFTVAATAPDGVTEALQCPEKKVYAVQWHPERMSFRHRRSDTVDGAPLFDFFLALCK